MIRFYISETVAGEDKAIYLFSLDGKRKFDYRARVSANAFFFGIKHRNWKKDGTLYYARREDEFERHKESWKRVEEAVGKSFPLPEPIELADLWSFYKQVGYDYKTKKWL